MSDRSPSRWARPVLILLAAVVAINVGAALVGRHFVEPSGPAGSSFATSSGGLAAYADLLERNGHAVGRLREGPSAVKLDPRRETVVVTSIERLSRGDVRSLRGFAERGGRVLVAGRGEGGRLATLVERPPRWGAASAGRVRSLVPLAETSGVGIVSADGRGVWTNTAAALPAVGRPAGHLLAVEGAGSGRIGLLSDLSPLTNRGLAREDNAALGLALAGGSERRVLFAESVHGFGNRTGLAALPARWWWALGGIGLAGVTLAASRARRLGPPESDRRDLPPARSEFVTSLAGLIERGGRRAEAAEPARVGAGRLVMRRTGLDPAASGEELRRAGRRAGLPDDEAAALVAPPADDAGVIAIGRALARLAGTGPGPGGTR